jgi:hypothetical protein
MILAPENRHVKWASGLFIELLANATNVKTHHLYFLAEFLEQLIHARG